MLQPINISQTDKASTKPGSSNASVLKRQGALPLSARPSLHYTSGALLDTRAHQEVEQSTATAESNIPGENLPNTGFRALLSDFRVIFERDPAARNWAEVLCCYPGLQALAWHRLAHWLYLKQTPVIPRLISQIGRFLTGIEIHPGAVVGRGVFIDHGMGVVIGETAVVGDYTLIYQGATLGGTGKESGKRHPTVGKNVVVSAGAKVLGNIKIGDNVRIGAGSVILRDVPADCTVVGVPARIVRRSGERVSPLEHGKLPDTAANEIQSLVKRLDRIEAQLQVLQLGLHSADIERIQERFSQGRRVSSKSADRGSAHSFR